MLDYKIIYILLIKDWDQTFCTDADSSLRGSYASVNGSIVNDVSVDGSAPTSRIKQSRAQFVLILGTPVFKWCHLIRCCMFAVHAFWPKLESQRTLQIAPFCRHSVRRSVLPLSLLTLFALRLPIALLSLSLSLHSQAMSVVMRKTSITLPDIGDDAYKIAEGCTRNQTMPYTTECVIQSQTLDPVLNSWCHWNPTFLTYVSPVTFLELLTKQKLARFHLDNKTVTTEEQNYFYLESILILY